MKSTNHRQNAKHWHVPSLDGVRGIALLIVMFAHTSPQILPGGNIGVDLFFVLSGFLITTILLNEFAATGTISKWRFYAKRALRLLPALFLMVGLIVAYIAMFRPEEFSSALNDAPSVIFYYYNWYRVVTWGSPDPIRDFGHLWSLSVEEQFYILWPILLLPALRIRYLFGLMLAVGIGGPAIARIALWKEGPSLELYFRTDLRFDSLMWGAAAAWFNACFDLRKIRILAVVAPAALIFFVVLARFDLLSNGVLYLGGYSAICALAALIIVSASQRLSPWLERVLNFAPLCYTGVISYGLYLWHVPVFGFFPHTPSGNSIAIAFTYAIATCSFYGMEKWFLSLKEHLPQQEGPLGLRLCSGSKERINLCGREADGSKSSLHHMIVPDE